MKLKVSAFALAAGLFWGGCLFLCTWWIILLDGASADITLIGRIYRGYSLSPLGSLLGLLWGLGDGFVGGVIFAWLYNLFVGKAQA